MTDFRKHQGWVLGGRPVSSADALLTPSDIALLSTHDTVMSLFLAIPPIIADPPAMTLLSPELR